MPKENVNNIINDWNSAPTVKESTVPVQNSGKRPMKDLLLDHGVDLTKKPVEKVVSEDAPEISKAQEIENLWQNDIGKSESQKQFEQMKPEDFKQTFKDKMKTMDIGERTALEKFLFGNTANDANKVQSFLRGFRGEMSETGIGVKQRIEDFSGIGDEETQAENDRMLSQVKQSVKTNNPLTTSAGQITGTVAELAPLMASAGVGAVPLLVEGAAYGITRPQEKGYTAADIALATGGEAALALFGGKLTQAFVDKASPLLKSSYQKITGKTPKGKLISEDGTPSQELLDALKEEGIEYDELLDGAGIFEEMKSLLKASPVGVEPEQAVRAARYDSLGIEPVKSSVTQGFDDAVESQVLRRQINDPEAASLRDTLANESEGFKTALQKLADEVGDPDVEGLGDTIRSAIKSRFTDQREVKSQAYKDLAEEAGKTGAQIDVPKEDLLTAWNAGKKIKRSQMQGFHSDVKESLMRFGVVEPDEAFSKLISKGEEELTPLTANNFESLRQELNANINPQDPATLAVLKPLIASLDSSVDKAAKGFQGAEVLTELSKAARGEARAFNKEFNSKNMVSDILKTKKGTFDTYQIRGQDIYNKLIKTSRKTPTSEQLTEVITTLEKSGAKGKKAIADLQSATIMNLLKDATSQLSAKNMKGQQFSYTAYRKALEGIGDQELAILFKNNKVGISTLKELGKAAQDSQTFFDAIPKGSAGDIQNMFTRSFAPLFETIGFAKAGFIGKLAAQTLVEETTKRASKSKLRKAVAEEIKAKPQIRKELTLLSKEYPGVFEALGISIADKTIKSNEDEK